MNQSIFKPFELGQLKLKNRIVMAPMTRSYSPGNIPNQKTLNTTKGELLTMSV